MDRPLVFRVKKMNRPNENIRAAAAEGGHRPLEIYIHIPFCVRKCAYCDFLSGPAGEETIRTYVGQLIRQIGEWDPAGKAGNAGDRAEKASDNYHVVSIFIGGGTPSILSGEQLSRIMEAVRAHFEIDDDAEITVECNPGTLNKEKLTAMKASGVNRLSIGLQSANDEELKKLGRIHTWEEFLENFRLAKECGFENVSVDLMSALPGQTSATWRHTLEQVLGLGVKHLSAYSLIIEEGTPFYKLYHEEDEKRAEGENVTILPSEEEERKMYMETERLCEEYGLERYEISNYAVPGHESRHNCGYWLRREYIGFGLGASSLIGKTRFKNTDDLQDYLAGDFRRCDEEVLSIENEMEETMYLGLRMIRGVNEDAFKASYGKTVDEVFGETVDHMIGLGLMERKDGWLRLTERGLDVSNYVMSEFLLS